MIFYSRQRLAGLSLIELMISMVISLILMLGVGQIMISGKQSANIQSGMGRVQENGRFAMYFLQKDLRAAGFPRSANQPGFVAATTTDGVGNAPDEITVQFNSLTNITTADNNPYAQADITNSRLDCLGQNVNAAAARNVAVTVTSRYYIEASGGVNTLMCRGNGNANAQPLIQGVDNLQALYGVDTDADSYANVYRPAGAVTDWNTVVSVRVAILVNTIDNVADDRDTQLYALLDAPPVGPLNDLRRRRVFTSTIEMRNKTQ